MTWTKDDKGRFVWRQDPDDLDLCAYPKFQALIMKKKTCPKCGAAAFFNGMVFRVRTYGCTKKTCGHHWNANGKTCQENRSILRGGLLPSASSGVRSEGC